MQPEISEARQEYGTKIEKLIKSLPSHLDPGETAFYIGSTDTWRPMSDSFVLTTQRLLIMTGELIARENAWQTIAGSEPLPKKRGLQVQPQYERPYAVNRLKPPDRAALQAALKVFPRLEPASENVDLWRRRRRRLESPQRGEPLPPLADGAAVSSSPEVRAEEPAHATATAPPASAPTSAPVEEPTSFPLGPPDGATASSIRANSGDGDEPWLVVATADAGTLAAFEDRLLIIKKAPAQGFMTGSAGGEVSTTFPFRDITAIEYIAGYLDGVLEIRTADDHSTMGQVCWSATTSSANDASDDPNTLPLDKDEYERSLPGLDQLRRRISRAQHETPAPAAAPARMVEMLSQLGSLHAAGVLTDEEFTAAKGRLLEV
ncbi:SHOCT domain-containing protein [Brachybacterium squillarum]|uniref:SHOCT domain-containing protein n=1 Tax=Brachybacterium squillarum TaxID=661979 RepID=UPI0022230285|nr:SHOCT domain-containing protein [Brachybacterium squillarum]MCW1804361.1 SHOCT domain-containing protein [Brachybacterium squillarum]